MTFKLKDRPDPTTLPHHMDVALIERMLEGILIAAAAWVHCAKASLKYARAIAVLSKSARDSEGYNVNLSIRAHVLANPAGIRWAINILGAGRIARWKQEFHRRRKGVVIVRRHIRLPSGIIKLPAKPRTYKWKLIALPKMAGLCFPVYYLGFKSFPDLHPHFSQPRARRIIPPAVFWPHELLGSPIKSGMSGVEDASRIDDVPLGCAPHSMCIACPSYFCAPHICGDTSTLIIDRRSIIGLAPTSSETFTRLAPLARSDDLQQTGGEQKSQERRELDNRALPQNFAPCQGPTARERPPCTAGQKPKKARGV